MAVTQTMHPVQIENPPGTIFRYRGDLVEGREWPNSAEYSPDEQNYWTIVNITDIDIGDRSDPANPWYVHWENNYLDDAKLGARALNLAPQAMPPINLPGPKPIENAINELRDRVSVLGNVRELLGWLFARQRFVEGDPGYRFFSIASITMSWQEVLDASSPRASTRLDLRPELIP